MSGEFVDTNILFYAHEAAAGHKHERSVELLTRLIAEGSGTISIQILAEFYSAATRKLAMTSEAASEVLRDLGTWTIHRPNHADLLSAAQIQRRYKIAWWDALVLQSAQAVDCRILWTEDLKDGQRYGHVTARNPFK